MPFLRFLLNSSYLRLCHFGSPRVQPGIGLVQINIVPKGGRRISSILYIKVCKSCSMRPFGDAGA